MENVIVTGANGFIGKTLVNALLAKGCRVTALDVRFDDVLADDPRVTCISVLNKDVPALRRRFPRRIITASSTWRGRAHPGLRARIMMCSCRTSS